MSDSEAPFIIFFLVSLFLVGFGFGGCFEQRRIGGEAVERGFGEWTADGWKWIGESGESEAK